MKDYLLIMNISTAFALYRKYYFTITLIIITADAKIKNRSDVLFLERNDTNISKSVDIDNKIANG